MNSTHVAVLTPPGSAAIAVVALRGPRARDVVARRFQSNCPLPELESANGVRFGRFGDATADEVVVIVRSPHEVEIHCHGGRQVVAWLLDVLKADGIKHVQWSEQSLRFANPTAAALLPFARTLRTASILLDQAGGAFDLAITIVEADETAAQSMRETLRTNAHLGRHLIEPWTVAIAGKPNAGKSTLMNALAGFTRSVVSPIPGTTRDAVTTSLAFEGWPVDLIDTAGLRESANLLEEDGIRRAKDALATSDLCLWVVDATEKGVQTIEQVAEMAGRNPDSFLVVLNKCDLAPTSECIMHGAVRISATTGQGIPELAAQIAARLVPHPPQPGDPVPFTPALCDRWS